MRLKLLYVLFFTTLLISCKKYLEVDRVEGQFLVEQVFSSDIAANAAIAGIYKGWKDLYNSTSSPTILAGLSSDELKVNSYPGQYEQFYINDINPQNLLLPWETLYNIIYRSNACIESLDRSKTLSAKKQNFFKGEALFIRAHCYFNLVNFFGPVPLVLTTNLSQNSTIERQSVSTVWKQIEEDLEYAVDLMKEDLLAKNENRLNIFVAQAFLARVYLYNNKKVLAKNCADFVIRSGNYQLADSIRDVFRNDSKESIFQFANIKSEGNFEALSFLPLPVPGIICNTPLVNMFETHDLRKTKWLQAYTTIDGQTHYSPWKYQSFLADHESYTLFRLAEQYLIRAEIYATDGKKDSAIYDINIIRNRAGLSLINPSISDESCMKVIAEESAKELFAETGHRWFNLKRTGQLDEAITVKGFLWNSDHSLFPIPSTELQRNPKLEQNPGY